MNKEQARNIIKDTLQNSFDKEKFIYLIKNLLNKIDQSKAIQKISGSYIKEAFRPYINSYERLASYIDSEGNEIDILVVYLQKDTTLERARTAQRNFVARYLKDRNEKDAALVAFVSPNETDWRFSLVKMEYKFESSKKGARVKIKEEFTPAKRWSFLVGENENSHTAQSRLVPIIEDDSHDPDLKRIEEAFNIEKVTKEFFEKYRDLFLRTKDELDELVKKDDKLKKDFADKAVDTADFAKKLLGQIVFLYFLQKKGWFGVPMGKNWGDGDRKFLRSLFVRSQEDGRNYFNDYLEPLFYEALAKERDDDFYSRFDCKIPFLNGGLFDPINNYDWVNTNINIHTELFSNDRKTKEGDTGDGILDIFDRYNFTVKEDEPLEKEVAVDPEMLGKVFENLLEVKDRKSKGTYYTPREIVHYMCKQSLINYLAAELSSKATKDDLEKLIEFGETVAEHEAAYVAKIENNPKYGGNYQRLLPQSIEQYAKEIDEALDNIKVCDPAIGSGAFPVGMMSAIIKTRLALNAYLCQGQSLCRHRSAYDFKFDCIQNSLYGVDIDPGAVEIAKLRLWLSLIVDEDDINQIKPLPNLDYKIMQGNSLIEDLVIGDSVIKFNLDDLVKVDRRTKQTKNLLAGSYQAKLFKDKSDDIFDELKKLHSLFFEENNKNKKLMLKERIDEKEQSFIEAKCDEEILGLEKKKKAIYDEKKIKAVEQQIKNIKQTMQKLSKERSKPFFLWKLHFSEVFRKKGGFDVVIANPPYVSLEKLENSTRLALKKLSSIYSGKADLLYFFFEKGIKLLHENGLLSFITSRYFLEATYAKKLRDFILDNGRIKVLLDFHNQSVFEHVGIHALLTFFEKSRKLEFTKVAILKDSSFDLSVSDSIPFFETKLVGDSWILTSASERSLLNKIKSGSKLLGQIAIIEQGQKTGKNNVYVLLEKDIINFEKEPLKKLIKNSHIDKYHIDFKKTYLMDTTFRNRTKYGIITTCKNVIN